MSYTSQVVPVDKRQRRRQMETDAKNQKMKSESWTNLSDLLPSKTNRKPTSPTRIEHPEAVASKQTLSVSPLIKEEIKEKAENVDSGTVENMQVFSRGGWCDTVNTGECLTQPVSLTTVGDSQPERNLRRRLKEKLFKPSAALTGQANTWQRPENTQPGPPPLAIIVNADAAGEGLSEAETEQGRYEEKILVEEEMETQSEFQCAFRENENVKEALSPDTPDECCSPTRERQSMYDLCTYVCVHVMI